MTLTQYKKLIKFLSREELEEHLFALFKDNKTFKDIESSSWSEDDNTAMVEELQKKLGKVFWKESFSLGECKGVLKEALSRTVKTDAKALMHLAFASEAVELSAAYGDFGEAFYNAMEKSAEEFLKYCKTDKDFFEKHEDEFEKIIKTADPIGYGITDDLGYMLEDVREDLGYYDDEDE